MQRAYKYRNVTISGLPGAGSSTLGRGLAKSTGWKYFSGGDFMRAYAIKNGLIDNNNKAHHDATVYSEEFDRKVDFGVRRTLKTERGKIIESWISSFMAQGIEGVLKILLYCTDDAVRVDRIVNRDNLTIQDAKKHVFEREKKNVEKWRKMYESQWQKWVVKTGTVDKGKPVWFWHPKLFDITIDTYQHSREETLKRALKGLGASEAQVKSNKRITP